MRKAQAWKITRIDATNCIVMAESFCAAMHGYHRNPSNSGREILEVNLMGSEGVDGWDKDFERSVNASIAARFAA